MATVRSLRPLRHPRIADEAARRDGSPPVDAVVVEGAGTSGEDADWPSGHHDVDADRAELRLILLGIPDHQRANPTHHRRLLLRSANTLERNTLKKKPKEAVTTEEKEQKMTSSNGHRHEQQDGKARTSKPAATGRQHQSKERKTQKSQQATPYRDRRKGKSTCAYPA
ncbi:hypothetical protein OsJ_18608 [Oryza sativa Japonica Group]|uniref:Uncharacterized protein n=1 Tax=Oryza sativa subsp. japonica TaxID=39947 RepID=B9FPQ0_ORYSJ|nr:hypothetical protein OsJ_18608 [Oryza sativa Japonica Group]